MATGQKKSGGINNSENTVNKDWFMRHRMFFAVITAVILFAGLIVQWKIEYRREHFRTDLPIHREKIHNND